MKEAFVSLTAREEDYVILSKPWRKSVLFPILNLNQGRTLRNEAQDAGSPMTCTAEPAQGLTA
jgi:hypothetical protein